MPISTVIHTNEQSIDRVLAAGAPVLLVFWSKHTPLPAAVETLSTSWRSSMPARPSSPRWMPIPSAA